MPAVRSRGRAEREVPKPSSDAYVGLLAMSLLALTVAMLFAFLNWNGISDKPKTVQAVPKGGPATPGPGGPANPPPQPGGMQGVPQPPGGMQGNPQPPGGMQGGRPQVPPAPPAKQ